MGDRGNIKILQGVALCPTCGQHWQQGNAIYLYTHWGGSEVKQDLANALNRGRNRWDEEDSLARIIFCEILSHFQPRALTDTRGLGISTREMDNEHPIPIVNCSNQTVTLGEIEFSFEEFVTKYKTDPDRKLKG